ncbi:glycosyltransferase [Geomonas sp. RF6]|uniref:glycosyltransferase n=1 Tax=Geomonas sp. RF6 TaxID=2897342 RepID=UPI001E5C5BE0|nr:glycosyltransferase [Geomonas sp. RF6]UFS72426.1 glycosyltransferase [Geomonas sp. RF6]
MKRSRAPYLVSAIVSTYNAERFLPGKLADLEAQTISDRLEIIVIDSASPQNERAVVEDFQKRYDNIRYIRTERRETVYQAWNRGIRMATGTFVANANTDDRLRVDAFETLVGALEARPESVLAYGDMRITEKENETFAGHAPHGFKRWPEFDRMGLLELCCVGPFPLWRRSLHDEIGYFDERFKSAADYEFWLRAALRHSFVHVPEFVGLYWLSPETVSRKGDLPTLEYLEVQRIYHEKYLPLAPPPVTLPPAALEEYRRVAAGKSDADTAEIIPLLERFVERHDAWAPGHRDLAERYYRSGMIGHAKKHFEKAVLLDPTDPAYAAQLKSFMKLELQQSLQYYTRAATENPEDLETQLTLGMICQLMERPEAAQAHYLRALELDPHSALALGNLAVLSGSEAAAEEPCASGADAGSGDICYFSRTRPEVQELVSRKARTVLDVGCAAGGLGAALKKRQDAEIWGIEPAAEASAQAAVVLDRVFASPVEEVVAQLPERYFDAIVCADVLEHLADPGTILTALEGKIAPGGELVASVPNVRHWSVVRGLLEGDWSYQDAGILDRGHLRFFTRKSALALLEGAGFTVTDLGTTRFNDDPGIPAPVVAALAGAGVDTGTLQEESLDYQYLLRAVPLRRPQVSIIIVTYNEIECTRGCIESIRRHTPESHEIILVDNGSTDGTVEWLRELCLEESSCRLFENGENLGFAGGCTVGMAAAAGEYLLLLNNDTLVTPEWLSGMLRHFDHDPALGLVGPMTNEIAGLQRVNTARYESVEELEKYAASFREAHLNRRIETDRLVGYCLLMPRSLVAEIGGLDTTFLTGNFEDDDLCLRAALAGYRLAIAGDVFIHHYGSRSFIANGIDYQGTITRNRAVFDAKWHLPSLDEPVAKKLATWNASQKGRKLSDQGRVQDAVEILLNEGIRFSPELPAPYLLLCEILMESGRYQDALGVVGRIPAGEEALQEAIAGRCHLNLGDVARAGAHAERALSLAATGATLCLAGEVAAARGESGKGALLLAEALRLDPGFGAPHTALARLLEEQGRADEALYHAELGFVLAPHDLKALALYHTVASRAGRLAEEEIRIREARELYPQHRALHFALIDLLLTSGNREGAMAEIEGAAAAFGMDDAMITAALSVRRGVGPLEPVRVPGRPLLSLCMIVKDERKHLPRCLASVKGLVDEIVVVDTGSTDRTPEIAAIFGARVYSYPWTGSFSDARNVSLSQATGDWILVLDGDEVLARRDLEGVRTLLSGEADAYLMTTRNYTDSVSRKNWQGNSGEYPGEEGGSGWTPSVKVRLFRNDARIRFEGEVHELVEDSLLRVEAAIAACPVPVHHYGKLDTEKCREKQERYFELGMLKLARDSRDVKALTELAVQATELGRFDEAVSLWERVLAVEPENCEALFNLGYVHLCTADYEIALRHSQKALSVAPDLKEAAFNAAKAELFLGRARDALARVRVLLASHADYPPALALSSAAQLILGESEGRELMQKLSRMRYDCGDYLRDLARGLMQGGSTNYATILLRHALEFNPVDRESQELLAACAVARVA